MQTHIRHINLKTFNIVPNPIYLSLFTSVMYPAYAKWVQSHRDLPIKLNQWCNVVVSVPFFSLVNGCKIAHGRAPSLVCISSPLYRDGSSNIPSLS